MCPSKSRNMVAVADGKLFSFGKLNALADMNNVKNNNFRKVKFFILSGFITAGPVMILDILKRITPL